MKDHTPRILIVDDDAVSRKLLTTVLQADGYEVRTAAGGKEALVSAKREPFDLVLLDIMMPGVDGFEVTRSLKESPATQAIPIIMVSTLNYRESRLRALEVGAEEFITKPVDSVELLVRVKNLLKLKEYGDLLARYNASLEAQVRERTAKLRQSHRDTIFTMTRAAEYRDEDTGAHVLRISDYSAALATELKLSDEFVDQIFYASPMHDIGKIGIPDHILLKKGPLTPEEWSVMQSHCLLGEHILSGSDSPYLTMGAEIARTHHERWDGSGYPAGLKGEAIPLPGRIMSLCDVYDALRSRRPYKDGFAHAQAFSIITQGDGRTLPEHFDPQLMDAFVRCAPQFDAIFTRHAQLPDQHAASGVQAPVPQHRAGAA